MEIYSHYNGKLGLICFAIYIIMLVFGRRTFGGNIRHYNNYWFVFIGMALYSVLGFLEYDTYHYYLQYEEMYQYDSRYHVEQFYFWLIKTFPHSFILFRGFVWGTASLLMVKTAKLLDLNSYVFCFLAPIIFLPQLAVSRSALGISLMLFCSVLFFKSTIEKKSLYFVLAVLGIFASMFLHKSMILFIGILLISYFIPLNKKTFIISLIVFPFLYAIVLRYFQEFSFFAGMSSEQVGLISKFQDSSKTESNINGIIMEVFESIVILSLVFNMIKKYLYDKINATREQFFIFKYAYVLVYIAFLFLGQDVSTWINKRTIHVASFALVLCATQCFDTLKVNNKRTIFEKAILVGWILLSFWRQFSFMRSSW